MINVGAVNVYQVMRNVQFDQWLTALEVLLCKVDSTIAIERFQFSNPSFVGPLQALIGSTKLGENKFYTTLLHMDQWELELAAKQIYKTLKEYNTE